MLSVFVTVNWCFSRYFVQLPVSLRIQSQTIKISITIASISSIDQSPITSVFCMLRDMYILQPATFKILTDKDDHGKNPGTWFTHKIVPGMSHVAQSDVDMGRFEVR